MSRKKTFRFQWWRIQERWLPCRRSLWFCCSLFQTLSPFRLYRAFAVRRCSNRHRTLFCPRSWKVFSFSALHIPTYGCFFPCLSQSKDSLGCLSYKCNPTLAKKGPAHRKRPKAAKIMATEVQSVRLWILLRKGKAKMKQIWLISFPENTQAVSCLTERVKKGWQFFSKPLIESQTVFQLWKGRQKDRRSPSLEQSPTMNRWLCRPVMKVFKTK